jgi:hypothetical protein
MSWGARETEEARIRIDRGFFLWEPGKWQKKAHRNERGGLNPSFGRVEETGELYPFSHHKINSDFQYQIFNL